jgi:hypothetical protein
VGGPRDGSGGAVADAMRATAIGCRACARGEGFWKFVASSEGGAVTDAHRGQSMLDEALGCPSSPFVSTNFMPPPDTQIICTSPGLMIVVAMAEPKKNANQTNTSLAMNLDVRRVCMAFIMTKLAGCRTY